MKAKAVMNPTVTPLCNHFSYNMIKNTPFARTVSDYFTFITASEMRACLAASVTLE